MAAASSRLCIGRRGVPISLTGYATVYKRMKIAYPRVISVCQVAWGPALVRVHAQSQPIHTPPTLATVDSSTGPLLTLN